MSEVDQVETEITNLCSLIAIFAGSNYTPNAKYLNLKQIELNVYQKQIVSNDNVCIVEKACA